MSDNEWSVVIVSVCAAWWVGLAYETRRAFYVGGAFFLTLLALAVILNTQGGAA